MNPSEISQILQSLKINPDEIPDKKESQTIRILLHIIEELNKEVQTLKAELQKTRDELNQLKGEQGKPKFSVPKQNKDVSSEKERNTPITRGERKSKEKLSKIKIDVTEDCKVDPSILPGDAVLKAVSYTHLRAHETRHDLVCRLLLEKKKRRKTDHSTN